jgi:choline-sulfatase
MLELSCARLSLWAVPHATRALAAVFAAALAGLAPACGRAQDEVDGVLLVTLDTVRADALGCYGGSPDVAPHLDRLAAESVRFDRARSVAPLTLPAHASMLTGLYPPRHGVHDNGVSVLPESAATLAELARERGVATGAVVAAGVLDRAFGLAQGFDDWTQPEGARELSAREVFQTGSRWLAKRDRSRRWFLWLHVYDAHVPYAPPRAALAQAGGDAYLGEISALDGAFGEFLEPLRLDGTLERALVLVVGDHGEARGEHGEPTHGALVYEATARVPFLARYPGARGGGRASRAPVSVVDVFPTAADALGLRESARAAGLDGVSLWDGEPGPERGVYVESWSGWLNYGWSPLVGWVQDELKYLHSSAPELYRLDSDAGELHDLYAPDDAHVRRATDELAALWSRRAPPPDADARFDPELLAELRRLGYGTTGAPRAGLPAPLAPSARPAPRARAGELALLWEADVLARDGQLAPAEARLRAILAENPGHVSALGELALVRMGRDDFAEAAALLERRLAAGGERVDTWLNLGLCRERLGDGARALEALERAAAIDLDAPGLREHLARLLRAAGREDEAARVERP